MKHDAFISYSHAADGVLAPALQRGLEQFAKPWYGLRALSIFRDATNLSASPHLWQSIVDELGQARWFLLMASRDAARSKWVAREVQWWLEHRDPDHLLILLTDGEILWDETAASPDFDWTQTTAVPADLAGAFSEEPHFIDLRSLRPDANLTLRHIAFRAAILKIAAPLHGRSPDQMDGDAVRVHARNRRWAGGAMAALVVLAVLALWQAYAATRARDVALSRQLAAQSSAILDRSVDTAMLLAVQAWQTSPTAEARSAMLRGLQLGPIARFLPAHRSAIVGVAFGPDAQWAVAASEQGDVTRTDVRGSAPDWSYHSDQPIGSMALSPDAAVLALGLRDGRVQLLRPGQATPRHVLGTAGRPRILAVAFSPDGARLVSGDSDGGIAAWDVATGMPLGGAPGQFTSSAIDALAFSADGQSVYSARGGTLTVWNSATWEAKGVLGDGNTSPVFDGLAIVPGADALTTAGWENNRWQLQRWSTSPLDTAPAPMTSAIRVIRLAYNSDGSVLAVGSNQGEVGFMFAGTESSVKAHNGDVRAVAISADGRHAISGGQDGRLILWDRGATAKHRGTLGEDSRGSARVAISPDGRTLVSGNAAGQLLWISAAQDAPMLRLGPPVATVGEPRSQLRGITSLAYAPDGTRVAVGLADGTVTLLPVDAATPPRRARDWGPGYPVLALAFSPDGRVLVSAHYDGSVVLRDPVSAAPRGQPANIINDDQDGIRGLSFSADSTRLLVQANRHGVVVREIAALATASRATMESALAFTARTISPRVFSALARSPSNGVWAWGSPDGNVELRSQDDAAADGAPLVVEGGLNIRSLAFSPDRVTLAMGGGDGRILLWDLDARRPIDEPMRGNGVGSMAFTGDGRFLVTRTGDGALEWWNTDGNAWAAMLCAIAGRRLNEREWATYMGTSRIDAAACGPASR